VASEVADTFETWIRVHRGMLRYRERKEYSPVCHLRNCHSYDVLTYRLANV
jgi:hypothetical protein